MSEDGAGFVIDASQRRTHHTWLDEITRIPTATGHEERVVRWIEKWCAEREDLVLETDEYGNMTVSRRGVDTASPIYFTAHLDHPAFVIDRIIGPGTIEVAFRGGVMADYFPGARIVLHTPNDQQIEAVIGEQVEGPDDLFKRYIAELDGDDPGLRPGDIATWHLPAPEVIDGVFHTNACDDLAAVAAALSALEVLRRIDTESPSDVRLLFTRAEEIGFIGAIGACRAGTVPKASKIIALENSRAFPEAPIGGGPIVRVGDRLSIFSPSLTASVARCAEGLGGAALPLATQKDTDLSRWRWQRKLMAGGACEATVFCAFGYEAMCCCLPLGNYHNMADLAGVQAGTFEGQPRVGREHIALSDYDGLVDLLVECGRALPAASSTMERLDKLWSERSFVL